ncbi:MAG TPA: hypothetical protein VFO29_11915 [Candidatus Rubrimentiphilum sp.]|nr:hypothetical protein [Candidatus Rubrimentiphilum sp.]
MFWRRYDKRKPPFVHPDDEPALKRHPSCVFTSLEEYVQSRQFGVRDGTLHFGLHPAPFSGDLTTADIFVLLLNPGFDTVDIYGEYSVPEFRRATEKTLAQDLKGENFPFVYLDPQYCWSGAYRWWERKLRDVLSVLAFQKSVRYYDALKICSEHLATIELIPYHSASAPRALERLPSATAAKEYVRTNLVPRAHRGEITLIVTRQIGNWGVEIPTEPTQDIVLYDTGLTRGAPLTSSSPGGAAILRRLSASC